MWTTTDCNESIIESGTLQIAIEISIVVGILQIAMKLAL